MDFQQLLAKMAELDTPATEASTEECGMPPALSAVPPKPDTPPPSMSVNLNAQGLDNIEELMKLIKAVNPDSEKPAMPMMSIPPLKMLPDFDAENDDMPGGENDSMDLPPDHDKDHMMIKTLDKDSDGDHDMDDHDMEKKDKDESFANSMGDSESEEMGMDAAIRNGDDLNKPKTMVKHSYRQGDNPMAMEELRASIREELLRRLEEAKSK